MQFSKYLGPQQVLLDVEAPDKWVLIEAMIDALMTGYSFKQQPHITREMVREAVLERERDRPTGLGGGFACPHARIPGFRGLGMCVALPRTPVDFGAPDREPAKFVALLVVPLEQATFALKLMGRFAGLLQDHVSKSVLFSVKDTEAMCAYIAERLLENGFTISARDIMSPPFADIYPDTPLREVTRTMLQHMQDSIGVVEHDGTLVGEITCDGLFQYGMPDFFSQLKSVSFIGKYDPFEKYFEREAQALARDVMSSDYVAMPETATLLEIVFQLTVRHRMKIHIVRDGKRVGVINRVAVLDRVLNM